MKSIIFGIIPLLLLLAPIVAKAQVGPWTYYNSTSGESGPIDMTVANSQHIEFKDIHGNTIHLMKQGMAGMQMGSGAGIDNTTRYNEGYSQGLAGIEIKGHHTQPFTNGWENGWSVRNNMIMKSSPWKHGYTDGVSDGQRSARDSTSSCEEYNSTADVNQCYH